MTYTIYIDVLFILNFAVDIACIYSTLYICKLKRRVIPIIVSSTLGGAYSILALFLQDEANTTRFVIHILALVLICSIFTPSTSAFTVLKTSSVFFGICAVSGGIITGILSSNGNFVSIDGGIYADISPVSLLLLILLFIFLSFPFFINMGKRISIKTARVFVSFENGTKTFDALIDTGNLLRDPISGDGIILIKHFELNDIFGEEQLLAIKRLDVLSESFPTGIRLVSSDKGLIPVIRPKNTVVSLFGQKERKSISCLLGIDFSPGSFGGSSGLIPGTYIE